MIILDINFWEKITKHEKTTTNITLCAYDWGWAGF